MRRGIALAAVNIGSPPACDLVGLPSGFIFSLSGLYKNQMELKEQLKTNFSRRWRICIAGSERSVLILRCEVAHAGSDLATLLRRYGKL